MPIRLTRSSLRATAKSIRRRLRLTANRLRVGYGVERKGLLPRITLPIAARRYVQLAKWAFTFLGLISAFFLFSSVWHAFFFGLLLFGVASTVEAVAFSYTAVHVHPIPDFEYRSDAWVGMGWGVALPPGESSGFATVSMLLDDATYARRLHTYLRSWTGGVLDDVAQQISVSAIEDGDKYVVFIYPSFRRTTAQQTFDKVRAWIRRRSLTDILWEIHAMFVMAKPCRISIDSYFHTFRQRYRRGDPFLFEMIVPQADGTMLRPPEIPPFILHDLKFKDRTELDRKDLEFDMPAMFEVDESAYLGPDGPPVQHRGSRSPFGGT